MSVFLYFLLLQNTDFCSCTPLGPIDDKQYNEYGLIIKGKVVKVTEEKFERAIYLSIDACYKGTKTKPLVKVISPSESGMCGIFPKKDENWLMFAYTDGKSYHTNLGTRTKNMNSKAWDYNKEELIADLKFLEAKKSD